MADFEISLPEVYEDHIASRPDEFETMSDVDLAARRHMAETMLDAIDENSDDPDDRRALRDLGEMLDEIALEQQLRRYEGILMTVFRPLLLGMGLDPDEFLSQSVGLRDVAERNDELADMSRADIQAERRQIKDELDALNAKQDNFTMADHFMAAVLPARDAELAQELVARGQLSVAPLSKLAGQARKRLENSYLLPLPPGTYNVSSEFGPRSAPKTAGGYGSSDHKGIDLSAPEGTPIMAARPGTVVFSGWQSGYGNSVEIDHGDGTTTFYAHMVNASHLQVGQPVARGDRVGGVGSTGNSGGDHLHYEVRIAGHQHNPRGVCNHRF